MQDILCNIVHCYARPDSSASEFGTIGAIAQVCRQTAKYVHAHKAALAAGAVRDCCSDSAIDDDRVKSILPNGILHGRRCCWGLFYVDIQVEFYDFGKKHLLVRVKGEYMLNIYVLFPESDMVGGYHVEVHAEGTELDDELRSYLSNLPVFIDRDYIPLLRKIFAATDDAHICCANNKGKVLRFDVRASTIPGNIADAHRDLVTTIIQASRQ